MTFRQILLPLMVGLLLWALGPLLGEDQLLAFASVLFFGVLWVLGGPPLDGLLALAVAEVYGLFGRLLRRRLGSLGRLVGCGRRLLRLLRLLRRLQPLLLPGSRLLSVVFRPAPVTAAVALGVAATANGLLRQRLVLAAVRQRLPAALLLSLRRPLAV